jgi:hypothetical protein
VVELLLVAGGAGNVYRSQSGGGALNTGNLNR